MADAADLKSAGLKARGGSSPPPGTRWSQGGARATCSAANCQNHREHRLCSGASGGKLVPVVVLDAVPSTSHAGGGCDGWPGSESWINRLARERGATCQGGPCGMTQRVPSASGEPQGRWYSTTQRRAAMPPSPPSTKPTGATYRKPPTAPSRLEALEFVSETAAAPSSAPNRPSPTAPPTAPRKLLPPRTSTRSMASQGIIVGGGESPERLCRAFKSSSPSGPVVPA